MSRSLGSQSLGLSFVDSQTLSELIGYVHFTDFLQNFAKMLTGYYNVLKCFRLFLYSKDLNSSYALSCYEDQGTFHSLRLKQIFSDTSRSIEKASLMCCQTRA